MTDKELVRELQSLVRLEQARLVASRASAREIALALTYNGAFTHIELRAYREEAQKRLDEYDRSQL